MRTSLLLLLALVACGDSNNKTVDAPPAADAAIDAPPPVPLDCTTYCSQIMANCTGPNAQYPDMPHCTASCAAFTVGTSTTKDTIGDTLGCRIYHSGDPAKMDAALHCPHAGPGGEKLTVATPGFCSGGDLCATFCELQIKTCGSIDNPVMVGATAITPQYKNQAACVDVCKHGDATAQPAIAAFDVTHAYGTTAAGNSLACRVNHWTNAATQSTAANAGGTNTHCSHTAPQPTGPCAGAATP